MQFPQDLHQSFDLASVETVDGAHRPTIAAPFVVGKQLCRKLPEMLAGVEQIDDLDNAGEVQVGEIPDSDPRRRRAPPRSWPGSTHGASSSRLSSTSVQPAGSGSARRERQICSLTAINSAVRF
jgi:hypothetical protein